MAFFTVVYTFLKKMDFIKIITFQCITSSFEKGIYSELCVGENTVNVTAISFFFTLKTTDLLFLFWLVPLNFTALCSYPAQ